MKELILIRHAKSDRDQPVSDRDRPLNQRGITDAQLVARQVSGLLSATDGIYSSPAKRALSTALIFAGLIDLPADKIKIQEAFYTFSSRDLRKAIRQLPDELSSVAIFGHNEAITDFVNEYTGSDIDNVPTSGFVRMSFPADSWSGLADGVVLQAVFPKDLKP